jgi:acetyl esterase/lipase
MSGRSSGPRRAGALGPDELLGREPDGPTFLDVGSAEVFRDEITAFASGLRAAGGQAELHVRPGGFHGFDQFAPRAELSRRARTTRTDWVRRTLRERDGRSTH